MKQVWRCTCCEFEVENTEEKRDPMNFDRYDSKRIFVSHLMSVGHAEKATKIWRSHG